MDKKLEIALELTRLVFDANSKGLRLDMQLFNGGESVKILDITDLKNDVGLKGKFNLVTVGESSLSDEMCESEFYAQLENHYKLSELPKVVKEYIENNTK